MSYDRALLLPGAKRNAVLELWEVERYGDDSYGDADHVSIYGMRPAEWYARGVRVLGRTAIECTRSSAKRHQLPLRHAIHIAIQFSAATGAQRLSMASDGVVSHVPLEG